MLTLRDSRCAVPTIGRAFQCRRPPDPGLGGTGRNDERGFHGEKRKNDTHHSVTDPDARLDRKSAGPSAVLCYQSHIVMEYRHSLIVKAKVSQASGTAERDTALELLRTLPGHRRKTVGGDKVYDVKIFIQGCREQRITAHAAAKSKGRVIDQRTQRHAGYAVTQKSENAAAPYDKSNNAVWRGWMSYSSSVS